MRRRLQRSLTRFRRVFTHTSVSYWVYRYRYLAIFTTIGLISILFEIALAQTLLPKAMPWGKRATAGFLIGMAFSFLLNFTINFRTPRALLWRTFFRFALVSTLSFALNMAAVNLLASKWGVDYGSARLVSAGFLFMFAYALHRRFTFDSTRNFGIAVYAASNESVLRIFHQVGRNCDHLHVDLVDETMRRDCDPVDLGRLRLARRVWPGIPVCLHVMSLYPTRWIHQTWDDVDWYLFHINAHDDLADLIVECRLRRKRVGVVVHSRDDLAPLLRYLAHVDFVMVLGISQPGRSGQPIREEAVAMTGMLDELRGRYKFDIMFDGGVNAQTVSRIRAKYIVAASAVLRASNPIRSTNFLKTGARYERNVA